MKIAIDVSPIEGKASIQHRVRGTGFYTRNLIENIKKYDKENQYKFFTRGEKLPKNVDLVHYPYFETFFLTLPLFSKFPYLVTVHDLTPLVFPKNFPIGFRGKLKWYIQKMALKRARRIIADSYSSKKDIVRFTGYPENLIDVIYLSHGKNFKKIKLSPSNISMMRKKYKIPEKFALYVGDVTWNKNLPRLIEAAVKVNVPLVMTGKALVEKNFDSTNPWNQDLLKVQELASKHKNIIRVGFVEDKDLISLYNIATCFVMPSLYEGFGLPILEAMACGCPVIASKEGSLPEVAGEAAYYVNAYDEDNIKEGIKKVLGDSNLREKLTLKGLSQVKKFSWKKTAVKTLKVYESIIK